MYMLWGGGAPFRHAPNGNDLLDRSGQVVRLLGVTSDILHELKCNEHLCHIKVAWVSCTDEPDWAEECLEKFRTSGGKSFSSIVDSKQIFKANKQRHFQNLKRQFPDIEYEDMLFFDNEYGNIRAVSQLGVKCFHCDDGMVFGAWTKGLDLFN